MSDKLKTGIIIAFVLFAVLYIVGLGTMIAVNATFHTDYNIYTGAVLVAFTVMLFGNQEITIN